MLELTSTKLDSSRANLLEDQIQSLNDSISRRESTARDLLSQVQTLTNDKKALEQQVSRGNESYKALHVFFGQLKTDRDKLIEKMKAAEKVEIPGTGEMKTPSEILEQLRDTESNLNMLVHSAKAERDQQHAIISSLKAELDKIKEERDAFEKQARNSEKVVQSRDSVESTTLQNQIDALERENLELQERLDEAIEKVYKLETDKHGDLILEHESLTQDWYKLESILKAKADIDIPDCCE